MHRVVEGVPVGAKPTITWYFDVPVLQRSHFPPLPPSRADLTSTRASATRRLGVSPAASASASTLASRLWPAL